MGTQDDGVTETGSIRLQLLGGFRLLSSSCPVRLSLGAQRLLAMLALEPRPWPRHALAGRLWPDHTQERAQANLRSVLWRLPFEARPAVRKAPSPDILALGPLRVDVLELTDGLRHNHFGGFDLHDLPPSVLGFDLLPGWEEDWVLVARERLRHLRLHALESLCVAHIEAGRYFDAVDAGTAAVAIEPLRESAHRLIIRAHLDAGNTYEAVRQYEFIEQMLLVELGVRPSARTQELMMRLRDPTFTAR